MHPLVENRRNNMVRKTISLFVAGLFCIPFVGAAADSNSTAAMPSTSNAAASPFAGKTSEPAAAAWKSATIVEGVRMGTGAHKHAYTVRHVAEWVRIQCNDLSTARADLVAGKKRDLKFFKVDEGSSIEGDHVVAQFSLRPGDRRVIQWTSPDLWWSVWQGDEGKMASGIQPIGAVFGVMAQIDWSSGSEPIISIY